jgi:hypothetical protein
MYPRKKENTLSFQAEKQVIREYYDALDNAKGDGITAVLGQYTADNYTWRAFYPFHLQTDSKTVSELFWQPFRGAVTSMQRRMDAFFAGNNFIDDGESVWVCFS